MIDISKLEAGRVYYAPLPNTRRRTRVRITGVDFENRIVQCQVDQFVRMNRRTVSFEEAATWITRSEYINVLNGL